MGLVELRRYVFAHHCHPVSAWSRLLTTPLMLAPFWSRRASVGVAVAAWFAINPVMTPEPADRHAFATRAMLGEERWAAAPGQDRALVALNLVGAVTLGVGLVAAWRRRPVLACASTALTMATTLLCWRRYAAIEDHGGTGSPSGPKPQEDPSTDAS